MRVSTTTHGAECDCMDCAFMQDGLRAASPQPITTNATITRDLRASLRSRGMDRGETFGDFIEVCKAMGIREDTPIDSIEVGMGVYEQGFITVSFLEDGSAEIRGVR